MIEVWLEVGEEVLDIKQRLKQSVLILIWIQ